jgi:transposase InsO family protein
VKVREVFACSKKRYGSPRVTLELKAQGMKVSRHLVARLMREADLVARAKPRYVATTTSDRLWAAPPNTLARDFAPGREEVWASDTTYLATPAGWLYLAVVLSIASRRVVGWATSTRNDSTLTVAALEAALESRAAPPLHHSDRGSTYASEQYQRALEANGIRCSMSRLGNCWDNAVVESFFSTLKTELGRSYASQSQARSELFEYIETFYNSRRRHSALGYLSPSEYEAQELVT